MSVLPLSALIAAACLLSGCGGGLGDRHAFSAKAWDTPFVAVRPIPAPPPEDTGKGRPIARYNPNLAAYGQLPASLDPSYVVEGQTPADGAAEAASAPEAAAAAASSAEAAASAAVSNVIVVTAASAPAPVVPAESTLDDSAIADRVSVEIAALAASHELRPPVDIGSRISVVELQPRVPREAD